MENESEDYFSDSSPESPQKPAGKKKDDSGQTALVDKALFPEGVAPGYKCEIEVVAVHESECEIRKLAHKKESESTDEAEPSEDDYS